MTPRQAAYEVVHHGRLSLTALAVLLKKSPTTLAHELRPPAGSAAKLGLETVIQITEVQNDDRILLAWAEQRGYSCIRRTRRVEDTKPADLLCAVSRFGKETGEAMTALHRAIEDGRITENEIHGFEREVGDIAPTAIALVERMRELASRQARTRAVTPAECGAPMPLKKALAPPARLTA